MCVYITLAIPAQADLPAAKAILRAHGTPFRELTPAPAAVVRPGDHYGTPYANEFDCETVVGIRQRVGATDRSPEEVLRKEASRLKRKRWSDSRIQSRLDQLRTVRERDSVRQLAEAQGWVAAISQLVTQAHADGLRLFLHMYSGAQEDERIKPAGLEVLRVKNLTPDIVLDLQLDVIYEFRAR